MAMEKKGVSSKSIDVIGVSSEDNSYICENCKKIVVDSKNQKNNKCPFCNFEKTAR